MKLKIAKYTDLKDISVVDNGENFVVVNKFDETIKYKHFFSDMKSFFDGQIVVRESVARKLAKVNNFLKKHNSNLILLVSYGYRALRIQKDYFKKELFLLKNDNKDLSQDKLYEMTHKKIAVPEVAGHPTGGAVDLTIYDLQSNVILDMGGEIADFSNKRINTFSNGLTKTQEDNRKMLLDVMLAQGFCPFYEEWWHFSYGDKEWAFFYDKQSAIYKQLTIDKINII